MAFKNIARYGYQALAGTWVVDDDTKLTFHIDDAQAQHFKLEASGTTVDFHDRHFAGFGGELLPPSGRSHAKRVSHDAFALGGAIYHGSDNEGERLRARFGDTLSRRLGDLRWVARYYQDIIDNGPYFADGGNEQRWWEYGFIVVPRSNLLTPDDLLMRVRTDLYGTTLYLDVTLTTSHKVRGGYRGLILTRGAPSTSAD